MANRVLATYNGGDTATTHKINFTATPAAGARVIVVVSSWNRVTRPSGWVSDLYATGYNHIEVFSKFAAGNEQSVTLAGSIKVHAVVYERDGCPEKLFAKSATNAFNTSLSTSVAVPQANGHVFGVLNSPAGGASASTWNQGLTRHYNVNAASSYSAFAMGTLPAAGSRTYTVSGFTEGEDSAVAGFIAYGSTDSEPPTVPGGLRATSITGTHISVEWDPSTDNQEVAGYGIYQDGAKLGPDQVELAYTYSGLTAGQSYTLEVDAVDSNGNRSARAQIVVVAEVDVTPPGSPPNLRLVEATFTSLHVAWDAASDNVGVAGYGVFLDGVRQGPDQATLDYTITRLERGTSYTIGVDAADAEGNRSPVASLTVSTLVGADPSAPGGLTATAGVEQITVAWEPAEQGGLPVVRYEVLLDGQVVTTTSRLGVVLEDLEAGGSYLVAVRAVDAGSARGPASSTTVTVPPPSWMPLASPLYRIGDWVGNARDEHGVDWVVQEEEGWSGNAQVVALSADSDSDDGGFSGPGLYGGRIVTLSGVAIAPGRAQMIAAQERLTQALHPAAAGVLRVADAVMTRQAKVRLESDVEIVDRGGQAFTWALTVKAPDPRRYAVRGVYAEVEFEPAQTTGSTTITLAGDYPRIPARLRLIGPVADPVIRHEQLGLEIRAVAGTVLPDDRYELTIDLATRVVWAIVPADVWPEPRPGRGQLAVFPARWALGPGPNTISLSGGVVAGQEDHGPRLVLEATDAWI
ncbi:fibronectin type III domain-containing protein [Nonomuraea sp. NPDC003214]